MTRPTMLGPWLRLLEQKNAPEPVVMMVRAIVAGLLP
jgi:hypothetical protein